MSSDGGVGHGKHVVQSMGLSWVQRMLVGPCTSQKCANDSYAAYVVSHCRSQLPCENSEDQYVMCFQKMEIKLP